MSDKETKPCPFCGEPADVTRWGLGDKETSVWCECIPQEGHTFHGPDWNHRPIEDALLARAEKAEAMQAVFPTVFGDGPEVV